VVTVADDAGTAACDRRAFEQIVTNLVDNAIKYCPPGTRITTRTRRDGDNVRISIEDTGPGIDQRHLPRLFERFYRVDPGRSREQGGTGLGLSIVKHLVEAMGGDVGVDSPFGQGTTFWFTVPHAQVPATLPSEVSGTS
jgi:two-component system phosphate regulon sensor histidine kinase PhoR